MKTYFFIGIGGSGMSAIAQMLLRAGHRVSGSDRGWDRGQNERLFAMLQAAGATLCPQDGSGITPDTSFVVVSTAIEDHVPDMRRARELNIPVRHRAEMLAEMFNSRTGVAVGGTSGKSTVTGMIGFALQEAGLDPSVINGGRIRNFISPESLGNTRMGRGDILVVESDESDGSITHYRPAAAVITNITRDHKPIPELRALFETFLANTRDLAVLNADCPETATLAAPAHLRKVTFSLSHGADLVAGDIALTPFGAEFTLDGARWRLNVPGRHNVSNALAAVAVARHFGAADSVTRAALEAFRGVARRFEVIGRAAGVTVIDDFAHNPDKIRATLEALAVGGHRNLLVFQCHGFGPTLFMKDELIDTLTRLMRADDHIYFPEIFYAGGTADRRISAADLANALRAAGKNAHFTELRADLPPLIAAEARPGDVVTVMGARDDTLTGFCRDILASLAK